MTKFQFNYSVNSTEEILNKEEVIEINTSLDENLSEDMPDIIPILPLKNTVLFPKVVIPITATRKNSIILLKEVNKNNGVIGVITQSNPDEESPKKEDLYALGTLAKIVKILVLPNGNVTAFLQGIVRFKLKKIVSETPYLKGNYEQKFNKFPNLLNPELKTLLSNLKALIATVIEINPNVPQDTQKIMDTIEHPEFLIHFMIPIIIDDVAQKQLLLDIDDGIDRIKAFYDFSKKEVQNLKLKMEINSKVHSDIDQQQRDYFLRQQMKVLQNELGENSPDEMIKRLKDKGKEKKWSEEVNEHFESEMKKLERTSPQSPDHSLIVSYLECLLDLPWKTMSEDKFDLKSAEKELNKNHYGLNKVKQRMIESLAVLKLKKNMNGPIICLYGPPGVGKTSLGKSIAKALGRNYVRMSLGGVGDEAEIRGHRKTYIGALPGKIIQHIRKAKTANPVFVLDEIDKLQTNFKGDPSSALLEVLDPEQNKEFLDNYLEVPYDLSKVLFITTANDPSTIQPALLDRMEIIELTGYTQEEKLAIAEKHLLPRQVKTHGLEKGDVSLNKGAINKMIASYTRESGVRSLERQIAAIMRYVAKHVASKEKYNKNIDEKMVVNILGTELFDHEIYEDNKLAGVVAGLAWTRFGGEILFVESALSQGTGKITLSGKLGEVMKESANTALSFLKTESINLNIDIELFKQYDLHLHVPQGAVPKDGPSAGIAILTALASVYTQRKVKKNVAMTGEITLKGKVLPVGGVKEKILAAKRAQITEIILPTKNKKDVDELNPIDLKGIKLRYVAWATDVLDLVLMTQKVDEPQQWIFTKKELSSS